MRQEFPKSVKVAAFTRANGRCEICTARLIPGGIHYDHRVADGMGGQPILENCQCLCKSCHGVKTHEKDVPQIAKAKRVHVKHIGARRTSRPLPGSKASGWKKKMDGSVERR